MANPDSIQTPSSDNDRNPVDLLADDFAERIRAGETPAIEDYVRQHPELESEIRAVFPTIARIEKASRVQLSNAGSQNALSSNSQAAVELNLDKLGDFKIIRQIGQGGMGIVYEALQVSLQRHVALKVISPAISNSPKQLARFKREAATAARLHHTNIVPVFGSGEEDGIHYFAMQLIDGIPLHEAVRSLRNSGTFDFASTASTFFPITPDHSRPRGQRSKPETSRALTHAGVAEPTFADPAGLNAAESPLPAFDDTSGDAAHGSHTVERQKVLYRRKVCELVADIADALQYAHEHGVLHRDIKPSNLLMDKQGTVWITDFGLAKFDDHDGITRTGDMVGTLRYMSPEQFSGDGDARSDVCSLGLTLFELLTLRPAYSETRSAPLMKLKTEQPPPSPRKVDSTIPRDLDTIVLKACAVDAKHRYQTAGDFREDLIRFVDGRPINARRASLLEQTWRWSKRNPLIASLASLSIALLICVAVVSVIANQMTRTALNQKQQEFKRAEESKITAQRALETAKTQKELADANFSVAIRAFEEIMENISRRGIPHGIAVEVEKEEIRSFETSLTSSDVEVLETLLSFFAQFAEQNKADLTYQSAMAYKRVAEIQQSLGRLVEAEQTFEQAIESFRNLDLSKLSRIENDLIQMRILNELAYCANRRGDFAAAESALSRGKTIYLACKNTTPSIKLEYARSCNILTSMYTRVGYVVNQRAITNPPPKNPKATVNRSKTKKPTWRRNKAWITINNLYAEKKKDIREANRLAIDILLKLIKDDPDNSKFQLELSRAYQDRVRISRQAKDQTIASQAFVSAQEILEQLVEKHPNNPAYRFELADLLCNLEKTGNGYSNPYAAARVAKELVDKWPSISEYQALYANAQARAVIQRLDSRPASRKRLEDSVGIYRELVAKYPDYYAYKINFSQYLIILASQYALAGEVEQSEQLFLEAESCLESMRTEDGDDELIKRISSEINAARQLTEKSAKKIESQKPRGENGRDPAKKTVME